MGFYACAIRLGLRRTLVSHRQQKPNRAKILCLRPVYNRILHAPVSRPATVQQHPQDRQSPARTSSGIV